MEWVDVIFKDVKEIFDIEELGRIEFFSHNWEEARIISPDQFVGIVNGKQRTYRTLPKNFVS